jgi:hypothetical protein
VPGPRTPSRKATSGRQSRLLRSQQIRDVIVAFGNLSEVFNISWQATCQYGLELDCLSVKYLSTISLETFHNSSLNLDERLLKKTARVG